jgi:hypothetical protein
MQIQTPQLSHLEYEPKNTNNIANDLTQTPAKALVSVVSSAALKDYYWLPVQTPHVNTKNIFV